MPETTHQPYQVIIADGLTKKYGNRTILESLDLTVSEGEHIALVGPSGCGKSTLLSIIAGLNNQTEGLIRVFGEADEQQRLSYCAWMPQKDLLFPWMSVAENTALSLTNRHTSRGKALKEVLPYLERFGLGEYADKPPYAMSGGMRQRASFVRTILTGKDLLLFDEPFGALDSITRMDLQNWLKGTLSSMNKTSVLVTHDVEEALILSNRVVVMSRNPGRIIHEIPGFFSSDLDRSELAAQEDFVRSRELIIGYLRDAQDPQYGKQSVEATGTAPDSNGSDMTGATIKNGKED